MWGAFLYGRRTARVQEAAVNASPERTRSGCSQSGHGGSLRHDAGRWWDSAGTKIETQAKHGRGDFQFLSQWEKGVSANLKTSIVS